jgi:hypothetical protein
MQRVTDAGNCVFDIARGVVDGFVEADMTNINMPDNLLFERHEGSLASDSHGGVRLLFAGDRLQEPFGNFAVLNGLNNVFDLGGVGFCAGGVRPGDGCILLLGKKQS